MVRQWQAGELSMKLPFNYGWVVVVLIVVFQASTLGYMGIGFPFWVEPWSEEFDTPVTGLMIISTVMMLVMGASSAVVGRFLDRYPSNLVVATGMLIFAGGLLLASYGQSFIQIFVVYGLVLPFATALTGTLASQALAVRWFQQHKHMGLAIGIAAMGVSVGGITLPPLIAEGLTLHDWRWVFRVAAGVMAFGLAPVMYIFLMPKPTPVKEEADADSGEQKQHQAIPLKELFVNPYFLIPAAAFFLDSVAFIGFQYNSASYIKSIDLGVKDAAAVLSTLAGVMLVAKLIVGKLTDWLHYKTIFVMAAISNCIGLWIFSLSLSDLLLIGALFVGLGAGGLIPLQAKIIATHFPKNQFAHVFGFFVLFPITAVVGSPLLSFLRDQFGSYQFPILIMIGFVVLAIIMMLSLKQETNETHILYNAGSTKDAI